MDWSGTVEHRSIGTTKGDLMAKKGDLILVNAQRVGAAQRQGEIIEVIEGELRVSYRVRWTDGHETLFAPAAGTVKIEPAKTHTKKVRSEGTKPRKSTLATAKKPTAKKPTARIARPSRRKVR
jgi:hypothetical protein